MSRAHPEGTAARAQRHWESGERPRDDPLVHEVMRITRDPPGKPPEPRSSFGRTGSTSTWLKTLTESSGIPRLGVVTAIDPPTQFGHPDLPCAVQMDPAGTTVHRCLVPLLRQSQSGIARTRTLGSVGLTRSRRCESHVKYTNATNWHDKSSPDSGGRTRVVSENAPYCRRRRRTQSPRESGPGAEGVSRKAAFGLDTAGP